MVWTRILKSRKIPPLRFVPRVNHPTTAKVSLSGLRTTPRLSPPPTGPLVKGDRILSFILWAGRSDEGKARPRLGDGCFLVQSAWHRPKKRKTACVGNAFS